MLNVARPARVAALLLVFVASWVFAYISPSGPFGGLSLDDFFYLARAWRLFTGELPDRDFVDPGAPLTLVMSAAAEWLMGRGAWSEVVLSATAMAIGSTLMCWVAMRVSGSMSAALLVALLPIGLPARLFSYPAVLTYSLALAGLVGYATRPAWHWRTYLGVVTAIGFLFRHDIGLLVALTTIVCAVCLRGLSPRDRCREALSYLATAIVLVAPYLVYLQMNGGLAPHFIAALGWARGAFADAPRAWSGAGAAAFYLFLATPFLALITLAMLHVRGDSESATSRVFVVPVIILTTALNVVAIGGSGARLAEAAVPHAVLLAWVIASCARRVRRQGDSGAREAPGPGVGLRALAATVTLLVVGASGLVVARGIEPHVRRLRLLDARSTTSDALRDQTYRLMTTWPLEAWSQRLGSGSMRIAFYLRDCTLPTQTVFIADDLPQLTALADRPFGGGHPSLRPGFFTTRHDQELTIARLEEDQVALVMAPIQERYEPFRRSFPLLDAYLTTHYERLLTRVRDRGVEVDLLVRKDPTGAGWNLMATGWYEPMRWPCFRRWHSENFAE